MKFKVSEVAELNKSSLTNKDKPKVIKYLDTSNITNGHIDTIVNLIPNKDKIPSRAKRKVSNGDIIYSTVRPNQKHYGIITKEDEDLIVSTGFTVITPDRNLVNPYYLYCFFTLDEITDYLQGIAENSTTAYPSIKPSDIGNLEINLPAKEIQDYIANLVRNIDEKIICNMKIITRLEQATQYFFKHWFIDFDFPNEKEIPYKSNGGKMVDSDLGEIPEGWSVEYLSNSTEFLSGGTPKTKEPSYWNGIIPFFTPKDVGLSVYTTNTEKTITELGLSKCNSKLYPKNTVFITARGTVGKIALANRDMAMNQSCFALKSKFNNQFFLYGVIRMLLREIIQGANGAVFNAINLSDLNRLQFKMPPNELIERHEAIVSPLFNQMSELEFENIKLQNLRDTLLPKLLSGEIEIPDESVDEIYV